MPHNMLRPGRRRLPAWVSIAVVCGALGVAGAVPAPPIVHTRLESSVPADGDTLTQLPARFVLRFSGPVNPALSELVVITPSGDSLRVSLEAVGEDGRVLEGDVPALANGEHRASWRTVSNDGHPVSGVLTFVLARPAESAAPTPQDTTANADANPALRPTGQASPEAARTRAEPAGPSVGVVLLAFLALACLLAFAGLLWNAGTLPVLVEPRVHGTVRALGWAALILGAAELAGWTLRVVPPGAGTAGYIAALGAGTGVVSLFRMFLVGLALAFLRRRPRAAAGAALAAVLIGAAAGHPAAIQPWVTMPANALHVGAASIWMGGLLLLVLAPDDPSGPGAAWSLAETARSVSASALLAVILIAASGILQSILFVGGLGALTGSPYGKGILVKSAGFTVLVGFGAYHRFRVLPRMDQEDGRRLRRTVLVEMIVMLVVVLVAAWLARVPPPIEH